MNLNLDQLLSDLTFDEGFRSFIYDDATGGKLVAGKTLQGKATLAVGWCPETNPCPEALGQIILSYFVKDMISTLQLAAPWIFELPEPCCRALCDMSYQLGVTGLLKFGDFLGLMQQGEYGKAANDLETTLWFKQSGNRARRIQAQIRSALAAGTG